MKIKIIGLVILSLVITSCGLFKTADQLFTDAEEKRNQGEVKTAVVILEKIVSKFPGQPLAANSQYLLGEIYYRDLRDYSMAIIQYKRVSELYPDSDKVPLSVFMSGFIYANMLSDFEQAENIYSQFLEAYPEHELAPSVKFELEYLGKSPEEIPVLKHLNS